MFDGRYQSFVAKLREVLAVELDAEDCQFLQQEHGYKSPHVGDFFVQQCDGTFILLSKERFERLYEPKID